MNKPELIEAMHQESGLTKGKCETGLNALIECFYDTMAKGERLVINGFASFTPYFYPEREMNDLNNPGKTILVPPIPRCKFSASKELAKAVNGEE